ncbi:MAG TPA: saccharopine dehydrogenase NADP-binding domain-containing protein [Noviherbaspirillum sp.]|uniref:saccharopine dehydrogenase family protein n=1 Tax=Noviherbaspirillum sp. TaxID=1926288 RepID=UPI002D3FABD2|nr:saccharopine dehydrogenase NADP-binding domain-containing protein [Noviherbaspirillum sp.]HYD95878.1 saccharopine dehydrogenase NADP-binding domain-containing protein [Noviherbaspirillum sp.]
MNEWLIYGANGYTGELIAREAVRRQWKPVLAGRNRAAIGKLAAELGLGYRIVGLDDHAELVRALEGASLVLHCAGPFSATSAPMIRACLDAKAHYLDITGEIDVFEHAHALDGEARRAGVVLCPGAGFDVIPTDCVAAALKAALPDAVTLSLGFDSSSGFSPGTARTSVEGLALGGRVRRDGRIVTVPLAYETRQIDFGRGTRTAMTIPWGDVSTAFHTTGIPNIKVFTPASPRSVKALRRLNFVLPLLKLRPLQKLIQHRVGRSVQGPDQAARERTLTYVWGEAENARGERRTARIRTANGYSLTVTGSLALAQHLLSQPVPGGAYTPAKLLGPDLVERLPGSGKLELD